jgi:hypothetical protein
MRMEKRFGVIQDFLRDESTSTGYAITFLTDGVLKKFVASKELYELQFDPQYVFPLITETPHRPVFNEQGIAIGVEKGVAGENINGAYGFGTPKTIGHVMYVDGNKLIFKGREFIEEMENGHTVYYTTYYRGSAKPIAKDADLPLELSDDVCIYCLNWAEGERKHRSKDVAFMQDIINNKKNCYWISIYDLYGNDNKIDCICMFRHHPKDPNSKGGDLSKDTRPREERLLDATGGTKPIE